MMAFKMSILRRRLSQEKGLDSQTVLWNLITVTILKEFFEIKKGKNKTQMFVIANVSPNIIDVAQTMSTLD
eukprot:CAMPEP_0116915850 /NCGR_PEP_ID=MMETSP0467-20121206/18175_1 /TAXON_ID=283647 /ORGANISM="Mesodinium pulex, Strain SPMC105" /LENGTH=70 /DNA_ID=CAMNT_0004592595 /DNA_START=954 /DNA_END=1166 /DNA_ORIENTATION=-